MFICEPCISNFGAILSNSFVNALSIEVVEVLVGVLLAKDELELENLRGLAWMIRGRQT